MQINSVVMNASPLICMTKAGIAEILPALFRDIVVPGSVISEIFAKDSKDQVLASCKWIQLIEDIRVAPQVASWDLGRGESQVISFALVHPGYWAVIDDREARRCSAALRCRHTGTLGIIVLAKRRGVIPSIRGYLVKLKGAGLWLSDGLVEKVCRLAGD